MLVLSHTTNMIKIPTTEHKFSQPNKSDLFGNIHYTKNINFDEAGYLKLSARSVSLKNAEDDTDFNIPVGLGRTSTGDFYVATTENPYILDMGDTSWTFSKDTDNGDDTPPVLDFETRAVWWQNKWHVTTPTALYYKTVSNGNWTDTGITALTAGVVHNLCVFGKNNTLLVSNGSTVRQLNTSYAVGSYAQLTLPTDYEVVDMAYNNNQACIVTRLSDTVEGQNKSAVVFIWDGAGSSANYMYEIGSDVCISVIPYKSSFAILTRTGRLLFFNGGGFQELAAFPVYYKDAEWGDFANYLSRGSSMSVDGDIIYINISNTLTDNNLNTYIESMIGGVWVYDPEVGLYHRYSPSNSEATILSVEQAGVNTTTNTMTVYNGFSYPNPPTIPETGNPVKVTGSTIGGLTVGEMYWIIKVSSTEFALASSYENAIALTKIDLTSTGGSYSYFMALDLRDYGQAKAERMGGIGMFGDKKYSYENLVFGGVVQDFNSASLYSHLWSTVAGFKNIGYAVTPKLLSSEVEDNVVKGYIKYRPLKINDTIEIKYKNKEYSGIPEIADCTATSSTVLTTTDNIADSYAFTDELECEVISGAGAGQMVKVTSITYSGGTYTITLDSALDGVSASDRLNIKLDNWNELITITNADSNNWKEFALAKNSKFTKFKIILTGSDVTVEEFIVNNEAFKKIKS